MIFRGTFIKKMNNKIIKYLEIYLESTMALKSLNKINQCLFNILNLKDKRKVDKYN